MWTHQWDISGCTSDQEASPSAGKSTRVILVPCSAGNCVPTTISGGVEMTDESRVFATGG